MDESKNELSWVIRLSDDSPEKFQKLKIVYGGGVIAAIIIAFVTKGWMFPVITLVILLASTYEFFVGRKYCLTDRGAKAGMSEMEWGTVKSVHILNQEVYLSPFGRETKLDTFRGVKLNLRNVSKENVIGFIREKVGNDVQFLGE